MTEKELENKILAYLIELGIFCWKNQSTGIYDANAGAFRKKSAYQINGVSDVLAILPDGRFLAIEVKNGKKGVVSDEQEFFLAKINRFGGIGFVARYFEDVSGVINADFLTKSHIKEFK